VEEEILFFLSAFVAEIIGHWQAFGSSTIFLPPALFFVNFKTDIVLVASIQGNPNYEPYNVVVNRDDLVTWLNADTAPHTVTSGAGIDDADSSKLFDSGSLGQGQKSSMPAEQLLDEELGTSLDYYCTVHPFMKGKLTVQ